mmetsp:Transcript_36395/g.91914  ORF Transcript_36395/g.91914 Transcript_36395/m.91914 type:complete len:398 (+) Transcript_36395:165-1358(+)
MTVMPSHHQQHLGSAPPRHHPMNPSIPASVAACWPLPSCHSHKHTSRVHATCNPTHPTPTLLALLPAQALLGRLVLEGCGGRGLVVIVRCTRCWCGWRSRGCGRRRRCGRCRSRLRRCPRRRLRRGRGHRVRSHQLHRLPWPAVAQHHDAGERPATAHRHPPAARGQPHHLGLRGHHARGVVHAVGRRLVHLLLLRALLLLGVAALHARRGGGRLGRSGRVRLHGVAARLGAVRGPALLLRLLLARALLGLGRGGQHRGGQLGHLLLLLRRQRRQVRVLRRLAAHVERGDGHGQVGVEPDERGGRKGQRQEEGQRVPVPVLREHRQADDRGAAEVARARAQAHRDVAAARVQDAGRHDGAHTRHHLLVLVADRLVQALAELLQLGLRLLHQHQRLRD